LKANSNESVKPNNMYARPHHARIVFDILTHEGTEANANRTFYSLASAYTFVNNNVTKNIHVRCWCSF